MRRLAGLAGAVAASAALSGCASTGRPALDPSPAEWDRLVSGLGLDPSAVVSPFRATPQMRSAARRLAGAGSEEERLGRLHAALLDRTEFGFENEKAETFSAEEAFAARRGNCVSFANLLVAFARAVGVRVQAALRMSGAASESRGDLVLTYTHLVVVHGPADRPALYDFYGASSRTGELRLVDDLEVAAIALSNRGVAALERGELGGAQELLEQAIRLGPTLPLLHGNLGIVLWRKGDTAAALACYRRGLELDPHRAALLHNLAALYIGMGRPREARAALAAAATEEASSFMLVVKGDLDLAGGDPKRALRSYRRAHAKDPALLAPLLRIARTERALGRENAARRALEKARRLAPDDEQVRELLETAK